MTFFLVLVEHATGSFIAGTKADTIDAAIDRVADWSNARGLDTEAYWPMDATELAADDTVTNIDIEA